jgi:hypothetical protein
MVVNHDASASTQSRRSASYSRHRASSRMGCSPLCSSSLPSCSSRRVPPIILKKSCTPAWGRFLGLAWVASRMLATSPRSKNVLSRSCRPTTQQPEFCWLQPFCGPDACGCVRLRTPPGISSKTKFFSSGVWPCGKARPVGAWAQRPRLVDWWGLRSQGLGPCTGSLTQHHPFTKGGG